MLRNVTHSNCTCFFCLIQNTFLNQTKLRYSITNIVNKLSIIDFISSYQDSPNIVMNYNIFGVFRFKIKNKKNIALRVFIIYINIDNTIKSHLDL